jgi:hypothetical protein
MINKKLGDTLKLIKNINENHAKNLSEKISNDEIKYNYIKPKQEVRNLDKIK